DGRPFYGGTYYPPTPRHGLPAFKQILESVASSYQHRRGDIAQSASQLTQQLSNDALRQMARADLNSLLLDEAFLSFEKQFDKAQGGFSGATKFPQPMNLEFLLRVFQRTRYPTALAMFEKTLQKMARGGMYDQIGGGFHRYSVDARWLVPHFE